MDMTVEIIARSCGDYQAVCLGLPGCVVCGTTEQETRMKIQEFARGYLASLDIVGSATFSYVMAGARNGAEDGRLPAVSQDASPPS